MLFNSILRTLFPWCILWLIGLIDNSRTENAIPIEVRSFSMLMLWLTRNRLRPWRIFLLLSSILVCPTPTLCCFYLLFLLLDYFYVRIPHTTEFLVSNYTNDPLDPRRQIINWLTQMDRHGYLSLKTASIMYRYRKKEEDRSKISSSKDHHIT